MVQHGAECFVGRSAGALRWESASRSLSAISYQPGHRRPWSEESPAISTQQTASCARRRRTMRQKLIA